MLIDASAPVRDRELLDAAQVTSVLERLHALRECWVQRHPDGPFYTFGAPSYLDGDAHDDSRYRARAAHDNPLLREHFSDLLEALRRAIEAFVGAPAEYDDTIGLPGFHVFEAHPAFRTPVASIHVDRQYRCIRWPDGTELDERRQISATVCLQLPTGGGGLRVWPVDSLQLPDMDADQRRALLQRHRTPELHPYQVGRLALHSGHLFHQIAPMPEALPGEARVTLQAHALPRNGRWLIYW